jgi:hypothetical protein
MIETAKSQSDRCCICIIPWSHRRTLCAARLEQARMYVCGANGVFIRARSHGGYPQGVVHHVDVDLLGDLMTHHRTAPRRASAAQSKVRTIELDIEPRGHNRLVFRFQSIREGFKIRFAGRIVLVWQNNAQRPEKAAFMKPRRHRVFFHGVP